MCAYKNGGKRESGDRMKIRLFCLRKYDDCGIVGRHEGVPYITSKNMNAGVRLRSSVFYWWRDTSAVLI